jgi:hypothetical protein
MQTDENFNDFLPVDEDLRKYFELKMKQWLADDER